MNAWMHNIVATLGAVVLAGALAGCGNSGERVQAQSEGTGQAAPQKTSSKTKGQETLDLRQEKLASTTSSKAQLATSASLGTLGGQANVAATGVTSAAQGVKSTPAAEASSASAQAVRSQGVAGSSSPYVRNSAKSPVKWRSWGTEAFAEAARLDRPVLISIGAGWCHWCHVMDEQTYANPEIAQYLNENFVPVKVDCDERPDVDARYQTAHFLINQKGGRLATDGFRLA